MLDTLYQVEVSELRRCGRYHHSQHPGSRTESRKYLDNRSYLISHLTISFTCRDSRRNLLSYNSQGICTLLVQGRSIVQGVRGHLACLTATRRFLKSSLFTRWGVYIWREMDHFSVDNHLVNPPCSFRGRPINESNIQVCDQSQLIAHPYKA